VLPVVGPRVGGPIADAERWIRRLACDHCKEQGRCEEKASAFGGLPDRVGHALDAVVVRDSDGVAVRGG